MELQQECEPLLMDSAGPFHERQRRRVGKEEDPCTVVPYKKAQRSIILENQRAGVRDAAC